MYDTQKILVEDRLRGYFSAIDKDGNNIKLYFKSEDFLDLLFKLGYGVDYGTIPVDLSGIHWSLMRIKYSDPAKQFFNENKYNLSDAKSNYLYAFHVIDGRFPEGEAAIASNAKYSYFYARDVIKGRFPEGEAAIASNAKYSYFYARDVIKGRFPEGEDEIAASAEYSHFYAACVLKGRFLKGEAAIAMNTFIKEMYEEEFEIKL